MDKTSLETFIKVAQEKSFSKAADKLHITQPAISKRISNLETENIIFILNKTKQSRSVTVVILKTN